jgi:hypothetical protein
LQDTERAYTNNGLGVFTLTPGKFTNVLDGTLDIEVADLDRDGDLDVVTANGEYNSFVNKVYINITGPADNRAPQVAKTEQVPDAGGGSGPYNVRVTVRDDNTSDQGAWFSGVVLEYNLGDGQPFTTVAMRWSGHDIYRGSIPGQTCGTKVNYQVRATDRAGNVGTGPLLNFKVYAYADCNKDLALDIGDFGCFTNAFINTLPYADCNVDAIFDIQDFGCFVNKFIRGCP